MERFIKLQLPKLLQDLDSYEILKKFEFNSFIFYGVNIIISPDVIVKGVLSDKTYIGAVKIHVSKSKPFDIEQSRYVATSIYNYLTSSIKNDDIIVLPELCLCIDIFADSIISAPKNIEYVNSRLGDYCQEIIKLWDVIN